jgi:hypothetical protein
LRQTVEWILPLPGSRTSTSTGLLWLATSKEGQVTPGAIVLRGQIDDLHWQLLTYDPSLCWPVSKFALSILPEAKPTINCFQALDYLCAHSLSAPTLVRILTHVQPDRPCASFTHQHHPRYCWGRDRGYNPRRYVATGTLRKGWCDNTWRYAQMS